MTRTRCARGPGGRRLRRRSPNKAKTHPGLGVRRARYGAAPPASRVLRIALRATAACGGAPLTLEPLRPLRAGVRAGAGLPSSARGARARPRGRNIIPIGKSLRFGGIATSAVFAPPMRRHHPHAIAPRCRCGLMPRVVRISA